MQLKRSIFGKNAARVLILTAVFTALSSLARAQERVIELPVETMTAHDVIDAVQGQTNYLFTTNTNTVLDALTVKVTKREMTVKGVLDALLAGSGLMYRMSGNYIIITAAPAVQRLKTPTPPVVAQTPAVVIPVPRRAQESVPIVQTVPEPVVELASVPADPLPSVVEIPPVSRYEPVRRYATTQEHLPLFAVKTNLLYGGALLTPNIGFEIGLGKRTSLEFAASYNPWNLKGSLESNKKMTHWILKPGFRYWLCERYNGHFFGADLLFARYNIGTHDVPVLFERQYRYYGIAYGGGLNYGYHLMLGKRWGLEFTAGLGVLYLDYDRYDCAACNRESTPETKTYLGPTNIGINLVFLIK